VLELNPRDTQAWGNRGRSLFTLGRYEDALASFNKVVELEPHDAQGWLFRGRVLGTIGHDEDALASFDKAIQLDVHFVCPFFDRASFLFALERWNDGQAALDDALRRFAKEDKEDVAVHTGQIILTLFTNKRAMTTWQTRIKALLKLYDTYQVFSALGQGLVQSIPTIGSPMVSTARARKWRDIWRKLASTEFQLPLRLLDVAVRYRETHDPRILLELPVEERSLLEPLLDVGEEQSSEP
jgi:tetratricopeptide (TPR) repeat protein